MDETGLAAVSCKKLDGREVKLLKLKGVHLVCFDFFFPICFSSSLQNNLSFGSDRVDTGYMNVIFLFSSAFFIFINLNDRKSNDSR